jgi:hypothetical protein
MVFRRDSDDPHHFWVSYLEAGEEVGGRDRGTERETTAKRRLEGRRGLRESLFGGLG